jgi:hypothetical protein
MNLFMKRVDMKKEIRDYLHLHLGCECAMTRDNYLLPHPVLLSPSLLSEYLQAYCLIGGIELKLILRHLSSITKDEMKQLWTIVFNRPFGINGDIRFYDSLAKESKPKDISRWVLWSGVERLGIELDGKIWADSDLQHWRFNQHEVTRFLLSKHFDLFGLIPAGLAIDATTLK